MFMSYMSFIVIFIMVYMFIMNVGFYGVGVGDGVVFIFFRNVSSIRSIVVDGIIEL